MADRVKPPNRRLCITVERKWPADSNATLISHYDVVDGEIVGIFARRPKFAVTCVDFILPRLYDFGQSDLCDMSRAIQSGVTLEQLCEACSCAMVSSHLPSPSATHAIITTAIVLAKQLCGEARCHDGLLHA